MVVVPTVPLPPSVPPLLTLTIDASEPLTDSVPALMLVAPVKVLLPVIFKSPAPVLVMPPAPLMMLAYVPAAVWSNTISALLVMLPCKVVVVPVKVPPLTVVPPL